MLYNPSTQIPIPTITGRNLAHGHRSVLELAFVGADLHLGRTHLVTPTITQCARLVGVCRPYVGAAAAIANDQKARHAVLTGRVPLLSASNHSNHKETLAEHIARSTHDEIAAAVDTIGVALVWDRMVAPFV
jgi:hypothetical protein